MSMSAAEKEYTGGCHCKKFRYKLTHPEFENGEREVEACTCSLCTQKGAIWSDNIPDSKFSLTQGKLEELTLYQFHKKKFKHYFCPVCGVQILITLTDEQLHCINVRSVDGVDADKLKLKVFDGKNLL